MLHSLYTCVTYLEGSVVWNIGNKGLIKCQFGANANAGVGPCCHRTGKLFSQGRRLHCILCAQYADGWRWIILSGWSWQGHVHTTLYQCTEPVGRIFSLVLLLLT